MRHLDDFLKQMEQEESHIRENEPGKFYFFDDKRKLPRGERKNIINFFKVIILQRGGESSPSRTNKECINFFKVFVLRGGMDKLPRQKRWIP